MSAAGFASPKSSTFASPACVIMTFEGLMSRWTMPAACAFPRASAICTVQRIASSAGNPFSDQLAERFAFYMLHYDEVGPVGLADVVNGDNVGVVEGGCGLRFVNEPLLAFLIACDLGT